MTILRSGPSKKFSSNWASAFGKKKPKKTAKKAGEEEVGRIGTLACSHAIAVSGR